jgi:hypothetical protein
VVTPIVDLLVRSHHNTTVVALANKKTRTAWATLSKGTQCCALHWLWHERQAWKIHSVEKSKELTFPPRLGILQSAQDSHFSNPSTTTRVSAVSTTSHVEKTGVGRCGLPDALEKDDQAESLHSLAGM